MARESQFSVLLSSVITHWTKWHITCVFLQPAPFTALSLSLSLSNWELRRTVGAFSLQLKITGDLSKSHSRPSTNRASKMNVNPPWAGNRQQKQFTPVISSELNCMYVFKPPYTLSLGNTGSNSEKKCLRVPEVLRQNRSWDIELHPYTLQKVVTGCPLLSSISAKISVINECTALWSSGPLP